MFAFEFEFANSDYEFMIPESLVATCQAEAASMKLCATASGCGENGGFAFYFNQMKSLTGGARV